MVSDTGPDANDFSPAEVHDDNAEVPTGMVVQEQELEESSCRRGLLVEREEMNANARANASRSTALCSLFFVLT